MNAVTKHEEPHMPADPMVSMIERVVMNPNADLDKLERMLAMKERIDAQHARVSFARALSEARAEIPPILKDATVDYKNKEGKRTNYQHETLAGIAKVIDPILSRFGISYRYRTEQGNGGVKVTCIIQHSDGHSEETSLAGAPDGSGSKNSFQAVGSAVTYLQRYTLKAALGLSAEVDDDGQAAAPRRAEPPFDAKGAHDRILKRINSAATFDDLAAVWGQEVEVVQRIGAEDRLLGVAIYDARNARKTALTATADDPYQD
jgi:hypothetical protein